MRLAIRRYWNVLAHYFAAQRYRVALLLVLLIVTISFQLLNPILLARFIDQATLGSPLDQLIQIALLFIGIALVTQVFTTIETYVAETIGWTATNALRADLALHCLRLDMSFHHAYTPGALIERVDGDVNQLANFFSRFTIQVVGNLVLMVGALVLLYTIDWRVGLALTLFVAVTFGIWTYIQRIAVPYWERERETNATFFGFIGENISATEDIRANGVRTFVFHQLARIMRTWLGIQRKTVLASYSPFLTSLAVLAIGNVVAFGLGAYLFSQGAITIGTVYLIFQYTELLRQPIDQLRTQFADFQQASANIERVETLLHTPSRIVEQPRAALPSGPLAVAFEHVSFGYNAGEDVLQDVSFQVPAGKILGLLGHTGSGKTTITRLLLRGYDPTAGCVRLGGVDLRDASLAEVRQRIGIVTQEVQIFRATVRNNLTFFDPEIADARIVEVLEEVGLGGWLRQLPQGLDTELHSHGSLSAGEAQLLAFARVFLKDPDLVILDEASSRLDSATERLSQQAIDKLLRGRTAIVIAHRLVTVQRADAILILDRGRIREYGARTRLLADPQSLFTQLLQTSQEIVR